MIDEDLTDTDAAPHAGLADGAILKILSGVQSGVEVSLVPGQYALGSGEDDDIQIIDVSLAPGHLQLRISSRGIQIRALTGSVRTNNGIALDPNSDWHEIEPLDVLTVGTTRLALGPASAAWTSITDIEEVNTPREKEEIKPERLDIRELISRIDMRKQALPLLALLMVLGLAVWYLSSGGDNIAGRPGVTPANIAEVHNVLKRMPFASDITLRQEVDGTIYATGYVDTVVERRAIASAIEETGVPVYLRIWVLQSMRQEIEGIIEAQKRKVTFDISKDGVVTLNGIIPNDVEADEFVKTIKEGVLGVNGIVSNLRTPSSILAEVEKLAQSSRIKPWVLFRFDNGLIEATGALPAEETDSWSGFLQVYARRFARDIGLRSFVQLQDVNIHPAAHAITIGSPAQSAGDVEFDVSRIQQGNFTPDDVLIGARSDQSPNKSTDAAAKDNPPSALQDGPSTHAGQNALPTISSNNQVSSTVSDHSLSPSDGMKTPMVPDAGRSATVTSAAINNGEPNGHVLDHPSINIETTPANDSTPVANVPFSDSARLLLDQWRDGRLQQGTNANSLLQALERLNREGSGGAPTRLNRQQLHDRYLPASSSDMTAKDVCWPASQLRPQDAAAALFWLDTLSMGKTLSLSSFDSANQKALLEVALNPRRVARCIARAYPDTDVLDRSVFLREIKRNPAFIRFIVRDIASFPLQVSGASSAGEVRFIQTRAGVKINEGASPDDASRLILVGELGAVVEVPRGIASLIYGPDLVWLLD